MSYSDQFFKKPEKQLVFKAPLEYCEETGKVIFDKRTAITAKNQRFAEDHIKLRIYHCPFCNHWHLTKSFKYQEDEEESE